jgi:hypothetical protein
MNRADTEKEKETGSHEIFNGWMQGGQHMGERQYSCQWLLCYTGHSGMNCLRSLERWDSGFESHSTHGSLRLFCVCVVLCR